MTENQTNGVAQVAPLPLPRFRCHKIVEAAEIIDIYEHCTTLMLDPHPDDVEKPTVRHQVSRSWINKHHPKAGGFFVRYADGYESYSPSKPFRDGYTRLPEEPKEPTEQTGESWPADLREVPTYGVSPADLRVKIAASPNGDGGAPHHYTLACGNLVVNLPFPSELGADGITHEALLTVVLDRLKGFQRGPFNDVRNNMAIDHIDQALQHLLKRTQERMERGVEGKNEK